MYESREELLQDLRLQYPRISYDSFDDSIDKDKKVFALVMIEAKRVATIPTLNQLSPH